MTKKVGKTVKMGGRNYVITGYRWGIDLFEAREVGRQFTTLLAPEDCLFEA